jgi:rubrerythrin
MERIWREKTDEQLLDAASALDEYTDEGRHVILAEMARRGLEPPELADTEEMEGGEEFEEAEESGEGEVLTCLRCDVELRCLGSKDLRALGVPAEIGHLFEPTQSLDVYVCPNCGHIDFFAPTPAKGEGPEEPGS